MHVNFTTYFEIFLSKKNFLIFFLLRCPPQFTGTRCEIAANQPTAPTSMPTFSALPTLNPTNNPYYQPTNPPVTYTYPPVTNPTYNPYSIPTNPPVTYTFAPITNPTNNPYNIPTNAPVIPCQGFSCVNGGTVTIINNRCACK